MAAPNPLDTEFCGLTGPDAATKLSNGLDNLADGTAIEDCAVAVRSIQSDRGILADSSQNTQTNNEVVMQTYTIPSVPYASTVDWHFNMNINLNAAVVAGNSGSILFYNGNSITDPQICTATVRKEVTGEQITGSPARVFSIAYAAGATRQVHVRLLKNTSSGIVTGNITCSFYRGYADC